MARKVPTKEVQTHFECTCGRNVVDQEFFTVRWKDFSKLGIARRIDRTTGKPFLLQKVNATECHCYDNE